MDSRMARSYVLSSQAQHRIFLIFHTQKAHIEHDNHSIETNIAKKVHAQIEVSGKYPFRFLQNF